MVKSEKSFFFNIVSKLRYDLFILPLCVLSLKIFNLDLYLVLFSASVDSWLTDREGVKSNDGDTRWCVLRSQNVSQSDDCHSVGFLFLTLAHLLVSISLSLSPSLTFSSGREAGFKRISFEFSFPQGPQLKPCLSVLSFQTV